MDILYALLSVLLGWFLGILSPGITKRILDNYKKVALKRTMLSELKDIKTRLVYIPMRVHPDYGTLTVDIFKWTQEQTHNFADSVSGDGERERLAGIDLENEGQILNIIRIWNERGRRDNPSFHFKKMEMSIIDSNLINVEILDNDFLTKLLEIKFQIKTFNEEVQSVNEYLRMTFDSNMTVINHQIIKQEIDNKNHFILEKAIFIVKKINLII